MTGLDIARLRELHEAATPGPWETVDYNEGECPPRPLWGVANDAYWNPPGDDTPWIALEVHTGVKADADLIAGMRNALPALLDLVEQLTADLDRARRAPVCYRCGHRHRPGRECANHQWRDDCSYEAGADCGGPHDTHR